MLKISNLRKTFPLDRGRVSALKGISIDVGAGDFFTLLGPSGSGKSTALRCVAGLEHPDEGEIVIGDTCVFSSARGIVVPPDRRPIGMVFQSYAIWPHMDVFQNVAFPLKHGSETPQSREAIRAAVAEALALVKMSGYENRPATQLSGGQQQRVALARALVRKPRLLLLDEPLSNLDAKLRDEMRIELKELTRRLKITSFFVTHDQVEALSLSDWIGVIMDGELVQLGRPNDVYTKTSDRRVAAFLGIANTFEGTVVALGERAQVRTGIGKINLLPAKGARLDGAAAVAIRPEAVECMRQRPTGTDDNVFLGTVRRATFLGGQIDGEIDIAGNVLRVSFNPYDSFSPGEQVYVRVPAERCLMLL